MATVDVTRGGVTHPTRHGNTAVPVLVERYIDLADIATAKGSALATGDVIQAIEVPAGSYVQFGGIQVVEAMTGTETAVTVDFGDGDTPNRYVAAADLDAAVAGDYLAVATTAVTPANLQADSDTLDITLGGTWTGTVTGGVLRVFAILQDVSKRWGQATLAPIGS